MSFKTMNGVEVYDKSDVDNITENINATTGQHTSDITQLKTKTNSLENGKANTTQVRDLENRTTAAEQRLTGAENNISEHSQRITVLENNSVSVEELNQRMLNKAEKTYAEQTRQIANNNKSSITELETRTTALEANKVAKSELANMVDSEIDSVINAKVAGISSDINHVVDNAIDDALEDYDTPAQTAQKTTTAINTALQNYDNSNAVDQKIANAVATRPTAMTAAEATSMIDQYF